MKFSHILRLTGIALVSLMLSQQGFAKEKVYTWTDSKGTVHYGERPPKDAKATLVKTRTGHSEPTPAQTAAAQPMPAAEETTATNQQSLKDPVRCTQAKENLAILNSVARIKTTQADGTSVYLTEEDKTKQREVAQLIINQACE